MKKKAFYLTLFLVRALLATEINLKEISKDLVQDSYRINTSACKVASTDEQIIVIRDFLAKKVKYALAVHQNNLTTEIVSYADLKDCFFVNLKNINPNFTGTSNYLHGLQTNIPTYFSIFDESVPKELQDLNRRNNVYLTVDLCPSNKPLERQIFEKIKSDRNETSISIAISGLWIAQHPDDFEYLKKLSSKSNKYLERKDSKNFSLKPQITTGEFDSKESLKNSLLKINWVNHSFTHPYDVANPNIHKLAAKLSVNINYEILENEKLLLRNEIVPTVFYRLPTITSNLKTKEFLRSIGLIQLDVENWLYLNQKKPRMGSFLLIKGNGAEPLSPKFLYDLMDNFPNFVELIADIRESYIVWK